MIEDEMRTASLPNPVMQCLDIWGPVMDFCIAYSLRPRGKKEKKEKERKKENNCPNNIEKYWKFPTHDNFSQAIYYDQYAIISIWWQEFYNYVCGDVFPW
jgi:hypothetical protein